MKIVLANGVFDILHIGHVEHLRQARSMGDFLIVSLTVDECVNKGPGRPIHTWEERASILRELRCVSSVFKTRNAVEAIHWIKPDIFVKGIDYAKGGFTEDVKKACTETETLLCFTDTPKRSVTELIKRATQ